MSDYLPNHLWMEIFVKLPIKSILSCTGVCRSWNNLIKSQEFISKHLQFKLESEAHNSCLLVHSYRNPRQAILTFYEENNHRMDILAEINSPFRLGKRNFQIVGTCNGLLCLSDNFRRCYDNVIVWNPLVGKSMYFPRPNITCYSREYNAHQFGFGYDSIGKDYKVVSIICRGNNEIIVEILKLSTCTWENISDRALVKFFFLTNGQVYLNGLLYWISKVMANNKVIARIVLFDLHEESFHEMELPETLAIYPHNIKVAVYMGSLAIVLNDAENFSIWTMTKYENVETWNRKVCINCSMIRWLYCGFTRNGGILNTKTNGDLYIFNPITYPLNLSRQHALSIDQLCSPLYAIHYVESLVFIDKGLEFSDNATANELIAANGRANPRMGV